MLSVHCTHLSIDYVNWVEAYSFLLLLSFPFLSSLIFLLNFYWCGSNPKRKGESVKENWKIYHCKMISMENWNQLRAHTHHSKYFTSYIASYTQLYTVSCTCGGRCSAVIWDFMFYQFYYFIIIDYYYCCVYTVHTSTSKSVIFELIQYIARNEMHASDQYGNGIGYTRGAFACDKIQRRMTTIIDKCLCKLN